jgi:hypothetical protein
MATVNFNDGIFAQEALQAFVAGLTPLNAFAKDFSSAAAQRGNAIYVPRVDAVTATTFNQSYTGSGGTINTITVNLDQHRITTVDLTDVQQLNSSAAVITNMARQQGKTLAKQVTQDIWRLLTIPNFGAAVVTTAAANWTKTQVRAMRKALMESDVDMSMASLIADVDVYDALLGDSNITQAFQYGGSEAIREGRIPRLFGMNLYETNILPSLTTTIGAFIVHPDSIAIAMRQFSSVVPSSAYEAFETVTDPESGITMQYRRLYDPNVGKMYASFECLFGYSTALTLGLKLATVP